MQPESTRIEALKEHAQESVTLRGWLYNKRGSKGLYFLELRDGSGVVQCVVSEETVEAHRGTPPQNRRKKAPSKSRALSDCMNARSEALRFRSSV